MKKNNKKNAKKITKAIDSFYEISYYSITLIWSDGRVVERGGLENRYTARYRGFKSLSLRLLRGSVVER